MQCKAGGGVTNRVPPAQSGASPLKKQSTSMNLLRGGNSTSNNTVNNKKSASTNAAAAANVNTRDETAIVSSVAVEVPKLAVQISPEKIEKMREEARELLRGNDELSDVIEAVCEANGWTIEDFIMRRHEFTVFELFLVQFPAIPEIQYFPYLVNLKLIHVGLKKVDATDLGKLRNLEVLWLAENDLKTIHGSGLHCCKNLRELYVYNNSFTTLEHFINLPRLEVLHAHGNRISTIHDLETLPNLRSLWLGSNNISSIVGCFDSCKALEELSLAGNNISSFRQIPHLNLLPKLKKMFFSDPVHGDNPVTLMSNYQTFTIFHLRQINYLDFIYISQEQRDVAEAMFEKKKIFYSMRLNSLDRNFTTMCDSVDHAVAERSLEIEKNVEVLHSTYRELECAIFEFEKFGVTDNNAVFTDAKTLEKAKTSMDKLSSAVVTRNLEMTDLTKQSELCKREMRKATSRAAARLLLELDTGGNVRLEEGRPKDIWYQSCCELLKTRFFSADYAHLTGMQIQDLKVCKVTRIHNRALRSNFDRSLGKIVDVMDPSYKRALEYLFYALPLHGCDEVHEGNVLNQIIEYGFKGHFYNGGGMVNCIQLDAGTSASSPTSAGATGSYGIPLTNSVYLTDQVRLFEAYKKKEYLTCGNTYLGRIVVSKVFLGMCSQEKGMSSSTYPNYAVPLVRSGNHIHPRDYTGDVRSVFRCRPDDHKQRIWYCFDDSIVLPEYIVDFVYVSNALGAPKPALSDWTQCRSEESSILLKKLFPSASGVELLDYKNMGPYFLSFSNWMSLSALNMVADKESSEAIASAPVIYSRVKKVDGPLTVELLMSSVHDTRIKGKYLRLQSCGYTSIKAFVDLLQGRENGVSGFLERIKNVTHIDLSNNNLTNIPERQGSVNGGKDVLYQGTSAEWAALAACCPNLETLDLSYNSLHAIPATKSSVKRTFSNVKTLNLSKNNINCLEDLNGLGDWFPVLTAFDIRFNPIEKCLSSSPTGTSKNRTRQEATRMLMYIALIAGPRTLVTINGYPIDVDCITGSGPSVVKRMKQTALYSIETQLAGAILKNVARKVGAYYPHTGTADNRVAAEKSQETSVVKVAGGAINILSLMTLFDTAKEEELSRWREDASNDGCQVNMWRSPEYRGIGLMDGKKDTITNNQAIQLLGASEYFSFNNALLTSAPVVGVLEHMVNLRHLQLRGHFITEISVSVFRNMKNLETLDLRYNRITALSIDLFVSNIGDNKQSPLRDLKRLDLGWNLLKEVDDIFMTDKDGKKGTHLPYLSFLALDNNFIQYLSPFAALGGSLQELYLSNNDITCQGEQRNLRDMTNLIILDLIGNRCCKEQHYRLYTIFHMKKLKVLDGTPIDPDETLLARDTFAGRLSTEMLTDRVGPGINWSTVVELNLASCALKELLFLDAFQGLQHLRLENNSLVVIDGLLPCRGLITLNLANNKIGTGSSGDQSQSSDSQSVGKVVSLMTKLESLSLESNHISSITALHLNQPSLKFLNLKNNEIIRIEGLQKLPALRELILDKNRIRSLERDMLGFVSQLREFHCNDNCIKSLEGLQVLKYLIKCSFAANRITDCQDTLRVFQDMHVVEVILVGNVIVRKPMYRQGLIKALPCLNLLDNKAVTEEERDKVVTYMTGDTPPPGVVMDIRTSAVQGGAALSGATAGVLGTPSARGVGVSPRLGKQNVGGDSDDMIVIGKDMGRGGGAGQYSSATKRGVGMTTPVDLRRHNSRQIGYYTSGATRVIR